MGKAKEEVDVQIELEKRDPALLGSAPTLVLGIVVVILHGLFLRHLELEYYEQYDAVDSSQWKPVRDYVAVWIPVFLVTIAIEILIGWAKQADIYRVNDFMGSMSCGSLLTLTKKLFSQTFLAFGMYETIWRLYGENIYHNVMPEWYRANPVLQWWLMFFAIEFAYYWVHRTGHTMNVFWAMHSVHHSSEEYNLSTALRQSSLHTFASSLYYLPLAFFLSPPLFIYQSHFNLLYQYWIHTRVIGKLGWLEYILNTPSQHRVHHGRNPYCIDTNYGGTLCIFDRLFGTFREEVEDVPVVYGVTHSINTFNNIEINLHPWRGIWDNMCSVSGLKNKFLCLYNGPGWIPGSNPPEEYEIPPCTNTSVIKYHTRLSGAVKIQLIIQFLIVLAIFDTSMKQLETTGVEYFLHISLLLFSAAGLWCIGITADKSPLARTYQVHLSVIGASLYTARVLMMFPEISRSISLSLPYADSFLQSDDVFISEELLFRGYMFLMAIWGVAAANVLFVVLRDSDYAIPRSEDELGRDLDFTAQAQALQLEYVKRVHGITLRDK